MMKQDPEPNFITSFEWLDNNRSPVLKSYFELSAVPDSNNDVILAQARANR